MNIFKRIKGVLQTVKEKRDKPLHLEFILSDHCNLNCKGCTHYSPLVGADQAEPLEQVVASMQKLGRINGGYVKECYLMGGETLMYPRLQEAMEALRKNFPEARLRIFTNGLLLPRMSEEFWEAVRRLKFELAVTRYPVKFDYDAVESLCERKGAKCEFFGDRSMADSFFKFSLDPEGKQNARMSHFKCYNFGCVSVTRGRIYPCSISGCIDNLNRRFGTEFRHLPGDSLKVDEVTDMRQIQALRDKPVPFCRYCKIPPVTVKYGPSKRELSEWV
ncbi:MAG: radical SAM protein [Muribaculum sp.]|nr:radical SAM protein [Muribaculum sp.]